NSRNCHYPPNLNSTFCHYPQNLLLVPAEKVWYVGDNPIADGIGANSAGIFPVWVTGVKQCLYPVSQEAPTCEHLEVHSLMEMVEILNTL
ncbi:MAG: HAD hydrolase-like protein, partial [Clostridia bacterium]|nr:HAD hydrolase-like protein [Clostridia bacterium]